MTLLHQLGEFLFGLTDKTRLRLVLLGLLLLGGGSFYKLVDSIQKMQKPAKMTATPDQLIKPMELLVRQTSTQARYYQEGRKTTQRQLDSLQQMHYNQSKPTP